MSVCSSAGILGTGHYAPERLLTNFDLEKLVDTTDEWIRTRTGVETRHLAAASENTSDLCVKAGWKALEAAGLTAEDIDFVMVATASPDYVVPSTACLVQDKMGMKRAGGMDISAGCSVIFMQSPQQLRWSKRDFINIFWWWARKYCPAWLIGRIVPPVFFLVTGPERRSSGRRKKDSAFWHQI